ncbi:MAG: VWA domain-containing protein, partial [Myxococcales bacterium]|nr:VWA domain-containing protein [Myxococcales bacterium]
MSLAPIGCGDNGLDPDEIDIGSAGDDESGVGDEAGSTTDVGTADGGTGTTDGDTGTTGNDDGFDTTGDEDTTDTTDTGEMCDDQNDAVLYLSPDDSNSMASPELVRARVLVENYQSLKDIELRPWEFMNYYGFPYPAAEDGDLAIAAAMAPMEGFSDRWRMQIGVASEIMTSDERPPVNVTLVVDTSGSLQGEPFEQLKASCRAIASKLRVGDTVSLVRWSVDNEWLLAGYAVEGPDDPLVLAEIDALEPGGVTDLHGGLSSGYELAQQVYDIDALNRLVLITDGDANAGVTDVELIAANAEYGGSDGIYLVGVGVGSTWAYGGELMDTVTDAGKGASVFLSSTEEAWEVFGDKFENTMAIAARNVQVQLTMPPGFEIVKFSGESFGSDPKEIDPQHLAPNDQMVFHQQVRTCAPDQAGDDAMVSVAVTWEDPTTFESKQKQVSWTLGELMAEDQAL